MLGKQLNELRSQLTWKNGGRWDRGAEKRGWDTADDLGLALIIAKQSSLLLLDFKFCCRLAAAFQVLHRVEFDRCGAQFFSTAFIALPNFVRLLIYRILKYIKNSVSFLGLKLKNTSDL